MPDLSYKQRIENVTNQISIATNSVNVLPDLSQATATVQDVYENKKFVDLDGQIKYGSAPKVSKEYSYNIDSIDTVSSINVNTFTDKNGELYNVNQFAFAKGGKCLVRYVVNSTDSTDIKVVTNYLRSNNQLSDEYIEYTIDQLQIAEGHTITALDITCTGVNNKSNIAYLVIISRNLSSTDAATDKMYLIPMNVENGQLLLTEYSDKIIIYDICEHYSTKTGSYYDKVSPQVKGNIGFTPNKSPYYIFVAVVTGGGNYSGYYRSLYVFHISYSNSTATFLYSQSINAIRNGNTDGYNVAAQLDFAADDSYFTQKNYYNTRPSYGSCNPQTTYVLNSDYTIKNTIPYTAYSKNDNVAMSGCHPNLELGIVPLTGYFTNNDNNSYYGIQFFGISYNSSTNSYVTTELQNTDSQIDNFFSTRSGDLYVIKNVRWVGNTCIILYYNGSNIYLLVFNVSLDGTINSFNYKKYSNSASNNLIYLDVIEETVDEIERIKCVNSLEASAMYIDYVGEKEDVVTISYNNKSYYEIGSTSITANVSDVLMGKTFLSNMGIKEGTMTNLGDLNIIPNISGGTYGSGYVNSISIEAVTSSIDSNITPENIANGVNILGVTGTFEGGIDTSDATATAEDILLGKTAYVNGVKLTGTYAVEDLTAVISNQLNTINTLKNTVNDLSALVNSGNLYISNINIHRIVNSIGITSETGFVNFADTGIPVSALTMNEKQILYNKGYWDCFVPNEITMANSYVLEIS